MSPVEEALLEIETAIRYLRRASDRLSSEFAPDPQTALKDLAGAAKNIGFAQQSITHHLSTPQG